MSIVTKESNPKLYNALFPEDGIKEILDDKKVIIDQHWNYIIIGNEKYYDLPKRLLNYITNLQTIEQQYSAILSENAELENKITNLQEELEGYKQERERILNKLDYVKKNKELQEENESLKNQLDFIEEQNHIIDKLEKENERLKKELNTLKLSEEEWLNKTLGGDDNE